QAMSVAPIGVMDLPSIFEHLQPEVAVLDDGVARPAADRHQRVAAHQAHGAMHDDGIRLIALDHADVEEARVLSVHGMMHNGAIAVAMILRRLNHPALGVAEARPRVFEQAGPYDKLGGDHPDYLGMGWGGRGGEPQCAGLIAADIVL